MTVVETKASAGGGPGWLAANEMWDAGCQSLVASFRAKGRERSELMVGRIERPEGTAREPFWVGQVSKWGV
jgi:hypothetical protein